MPELTLICPLARISDPGSFGFSVEIGNQRIDGFVVQRDGECFAYRNACPHTGSPLDWVEHQFLDLDEALIQCSTHDARFLIDTGECVFGPCPGQSLDALQIVVHDENIYLVGDA